MKKLSELLAMYRTDRPDEWTMDEFKRAAVVLEAENARLQSVIDEANAQEPVAVMNEKGAVMTKLQCDDDEVFDICCRVQQPLYAAPVPAQQSPAVAVPDEETNFCALKAITDSQVNAVARAFWRRIYPYRNDYGIELPKPLPVEFMAHMATALTWVDKKQTPRITEQDVREILESYWNSHDDSGDWLKSEDGRALFDKLNGVKNETN